MFRTTMDYLMILDERLTVLYQDVLVFSKSYSRKKVRCANAAWYGYAEFKGKGFKPRLIRIIGHDRRPVGWEPPPIPEVMKGIHSIGDPEVDKWFMAYQKSLSAFTATLDPQSQKNEPLLRSSEAYDIAYDELYQLLPNCRGCLCG